MKQLIYKTKPGYDSRNRCSFNRCLKMSRDGAEVTSSGRSFHMRAPATGKARCPIVGSLTTEAHSSLSCQLSLAVASHVAYRLVALAYCASCLSVRLSVPHSSGLLTGKPKMRTKAKLKRCPGQQSSAFQCKGSKVKRTTAQ